VKKYLLIKFPFGVEAFQGLQVLLENGNVRLEKGLPEGLHDAQEAGLVDHLGSIL
jgi:hypothetical protein